MSTMDNYPQADFYDAVALDDWDTLGPVVRGALAPWRAKNGVAVDVGAGTGLSTQVVAGSFAGEVLACEPAFALRASLMTRVISNPALADRTTILPWDVSTMVEEVAEPLTVVTAFNMVGHLGPETRTAVWAWLGRWLTDDGVAVLGPLAEQDIPAHEVIMPTRAVGRLDYSATARWESLDATYGRWHLTWRVHDDNALVEERSSSFDWQRTHPDLLITELAQHHLAARLADGGLLLVQRA